MKTILINAMMLYFILEPSTQSIPPMLFLSPILQPRYISGSLHYSRVPSMYWRDRLSKMRAAGLNAVQTYVPWNFHESSPGAYDFEGDRDLVSFIKQAGEEGLLVIMRVGPYICAEWDMGGFPSWLLKEKGIVLRSSDAVYLSYVDRWMDVLLPKLVPVLYENGGPVIMVQVENEYGSYFTCDSAYLMHLHDLFRRSLGENIILFTTDGDSEQLLKCGAIPSKMYATVDFGITTDPAKNFESQRTAEPKGPLVNSEFYTGWLDYWGKPHQTRSITEVAATLDAMLALNASVNMYMFEGGTNFAFWNGADVVSNYLPEPTSYDYDAPLTEAGDITEKYKAIRDVIAKYQPVPGDIPVSTNKSAYGVVKMTQYASLFDAPSLILKKTTSALPMSMEGLDQNFGFVLYTKNLTFQVDRSTDTELEINGLHDRASVYVNREYQGTAMRQTGEDKPIQISVTVPPASVLLLEILVENMGRINYGSLINDSKGILGDIKFGGQTETNWTSQAIPLNNTETIPFMSFNSSTNPPTSTTFFRGSFNIAADSLADTYLSVGKWGKGVAFVNGFNLGRYWPGKGPQKTLYVPVSVLHAGMNSLVLFEIDKAPCSGDLKECFAQFVDVPDIGN